MPILTTTACLPKTNSPATKRARPDTICSTSAQTTRRNTRYGEWNWYVKADNLLNQSVYAHSSFLSDTPQMGRSFTGGVNVKF